jgi:type I restriction enzyme R subunit
MPNQNPEQIARDQIDAALVKSGWIIQGMKQLNLHAGIGVAVKEFQTDVGPADYMLFVDGKPCGLVEAKKSDEGHRLNVHEAQAVGYAKSQLKHLHNQTLPFVFLSTGEITRFIDFQDPRPRAREVFSFQQPEWLRQCLKKTKSLRGRLLDLPVLQTAVGKE